LRVLHILKEKPSATVERIIALQAEENEVETVELYNEDVDHLDLLRRIFSCDRVISW
jgi:hypothetical protein